MRGRSVFDLAPLNSSGVKRPDRHPATAEKSTRSQSQTPARIWKPIWLVPRTMRVK